MLLGAMIDRWFDESSKSNSTLSGCVEEKALELAGPSPVPPLVATLAVTAAICWAEYQFRMMCVKPTKFRQPDVVDTGVNRAFKRWMEAARTLASVQRLHLPAVQINVAHGPQQVVNNPGS